MKSKSLFYGVAGVLLFLVLVQSVQAASYGYVTQWGSFGTGDGQFNLPFGVAVGPSGLVYVADSGNDRIQEFYPGGTFGTKWGSSGSNIGDFNSPWGVAVDSSDNRYVADTNNHRIQKFKPGNPTTLLLGGPGFTAPKAVAVDTSGNVYVADTYNNRVQVFDSGGTYVTLWGSGGTGNGEFDEPVGIAVSSSGDVYVVDSHNNRVQKFDSGGAYVTQWGSLGTGNGQFQSPWGIAVDSSGNVYIADTGNHRIQVFDSGGAYVTQWGSSGTGNGQFLNPAGVAVDTSGNVYVADSNNHRIQKFAPLVAAFSGTPTSVTTSMPVAFTDESTGGPTGWAWFFGDETYSDPWTQQTAGAGWTARYGHSSVVMPDGSIVLMGGTTGVIYENDVWHSLDGGATWHQHPVDSTPGKWWSGRYGHSSVVMPDGSIVLMGGSYKNDVWRSTDYGASWTQVKPDDGNGWTARAVHSSVVMPDGSIVLMGGYDGTNSNNEVWHSLDGGATWHQHSVDSTPGKWWSARYLQSSVVMPDGTIVLMGGVVGGAYVTDVWQSPDGGATWTQVNSHAGTMGGVTSAVVMPDGSIVMMAGFSAHNMWRSTDKGATWTQLPDAGWPMRSSETSVAMPDGSIVLMGGSSGGYMNDVWRLMPAGSSAQNPSHIYITPGTYQVALQSYNAGGYNSTRKTGYITVGPPATPAPTVSGITPATGVNTGTVAITNLAGTNFEPPYANVILTPVNANPVHKGSIVDGAGGALLYQPRNVYVSGNYAYVTSILSDALEIVDVSDPAHPVHKGSIVDGSGGANLSGPEGLYVSGNYAYIASWPRQGYDGALEIVDVSDPAHPIHKGSIINGTGGALLVEPWSVYVSGNYAYLTSSNLIGDALEIVDISDPANPVHKGSIINGAGGALLSGARNVYVSGNYAYVTSPFSNALEIVDVSDPAHPVHKGSITDGGGAHLQYPMGVYVSGNYVYVTSLGSAALEIVDVSDPAHPIHKGSIVNNQGGALLYAPWAVYISGNYAYVASRDDGSLEIIDVTDPANPVHKGSITDGDGGALLHDPWNVYISGNYAYVVNEWQNSLEIVDIGTVTGTGVNVVSPTQITGTLDLTGKDPGPYNVVVTNPDGQFGVLAGGFLVTAPSGPTPAPAVTGVSPPGGLEAGGTVVTVSGSGFLYGVNAVNFGANPAPPPIVNSDTSLTVTAPAGSGIVDITVVGPGGTSAITPSDQYQYIPITPPPTPTVTLTAPNGGEMWHNGMTRQVTWTSLGISPGAVMNLTLMKGGSPVRNIVSGLDPSLVSYTFTVPVGVEPGNDYRVMISDFQDMITDQSDADFTINEASATGRINVNSTPVQGAWILLDDVAVDFRPWNWTNKTLYGVPPGLHDLTVGKTGYFNASRQVTVTTGVTSTEEFVLDPLTGNPAADAAVQTVLKKLLNDDTSGISVSVSPNPVKAGDTINQWDNTKPSFSAPCDGYFVFIDMAPGANWEHPVKYVFVCNDGTLTSYDAWSPSSISVTYATGVVTSPGEVWQPDDPYVWTPACTNDCANNYALLIDGGKDANNNFVRYWNDIAFMYIALKEYNYDTTNKVTVMMSDGGGVDADRCIAGYPTCTQTQNSPLDLDGDGTNEAILDAGKTTILNKLDSWKPGLSTSLPAGANLLIFTTGHGGVDASGKQYIYTWLGTGTGQYITDYDLMLKLNQLTQVNSITLVMENCNSGGFASEFLAGLPTQKRRIMYAAAADEPSWGNGFSNALTTGYAGHTRYYTRTCTPQTCAAELDKGADTPTRDERVTAAEAVAYAKLKDPYYTSSSTPVAGKERSDIQANSVATNDATTLYLSACTGTAAQSITVKTPATNAVWYAGTEHLINWDAPGMANRNVKMTLYNGSTAYNVIVASPGVPATNPAQYPWRIPNDGSIKIYSPLSAVYKVKIEDTNNPNVNGFSGVFKIGPAPTANGNLKIVATDRDTPTTYLGPLYKVINPVNGAVVYSGTITAPSSGVTTGPYLPSAQGDYKVGLTLDTPVPYYPVNNYPASVGTGTATVTIPMTKIPTDVNGHVTDFPPYGGIDASSSPTGASIWVTEAGTTQEKLVGKTDQVVYLPPAIYTVQVKKFGHINSDPQTVTVESLTPTRGPVKMSFTLTPETWLYNFDGFYAPIDMNGIINTAKAGQAVPVKWHLFNVNGDVSDPTSFDSLQSYPVSCTDFIGDLEDAVPEAAPGNSGLQYLGSGNWQFNWKTDKGYAKQCRNMFVLFKNGQKSYEAQFKFK